MIVRKSIFLLPFLWLVHIANANANEGETLTNPQAKEALLVAFGGKDVVQNIASFQGSMNVSFPNKPDRVSSFYYDFKQHRLIQHNHSSQQTEIVTCTRAVEHNGSKINSLTKERKLQLIENMQLNFLYFLRSPELTLIGPLEVTEHTELTWWKLKVNSIESLPLGLNPNTGQIEKVLFDDGKYIIESHYIALENGLKWPEKFELFDKTESLLTGFYSDMGINKAPQLPVPNWFNSQKNSQCK